MSYEISHNNDEEQQTKEENECNKDVYFYEAMFEKFEIVMKKSRKHVMNEPSGQRAMKEEREINGKEWEREINTIPQPQELRNQDGKKVEREKRIIYKDQKNIIKDKNEAMVNVHQMMIEKYEESKKRIYKYLWKYYSHKLQRLTGAVSEKF